MELRLKASEEGVTIAKSSWYPQVMAGANYIYANPNQRIFPSKDQFNGTWDVGLSLSFDIWNWQTASYQTAQAEAARDQSQTALAQAKDAVILDVTSSYLTALKAKHKMGKAEEGVQQAEENYRVTNGKFKSGMAINSDLLDAESALLQAKVNSTTAVVDYLIALAKLDKATGK
jgi:outer membrane protein TolC